MASQTQKQKTTSDKPEVEVAEAPATSEKGEKLKTELDDLLDEIDGVLEENAQEFVDSFVQKGGQ